MFILAFIICTVVIFIVSTKINRKRYDELNLMLNQILEGKEVTYPDTKDTRASKISHQVKKIKDMIEIEVEQSKSEKEAEYTNLSINTIIKKIIEESIESRKLDNISSELADRLNIQEQALETMCQNILEVNYKLAILISLMNSVFEFEEDDVG